MCSHTVEVLSCGLRLVAPPTLNPVVLMVCADGRSATHRILLVVMMGEESNKELQTINWSVVWRWGMITSVYEKSSETSQKLLLILGCGEEVQHCGLWSHHSLVRTQPAQPKPKVLFKISLAFIINLILYFDGVKSHRLYKLFFPNKMQD